MYKILILIQIYDNLDLRQEIRNKHLFHHHSHEYIAFLCKIISFYI